jgi:hypothetical protein
VLPLSPLLSHRKQLRRLVVDTLEQVFFHTIEDLIDFSLIEIEQPLNMIPKTPSGNYYEPDDFESDEESSKSDHSTYESKDMEDNNNNNEERGNKLEDNQPWLARDALVITGRVHNLPQHPVKLLAKFDPGTYLLLEDHIKKFILAIRLMNVQHEDLVCRIIPLRIQPQLGILTFHLDP